MQPPIFAKAVSAGGSCVPARAGRGDLRRLWLELLAGLCWNAA